MKKNLTRLLLFSFLSIFLFYNCQKENKNESTHEESLNSLVAKMSQNKDFQNLITSLPQVRKENSKILKPILQSKKDLNSVSAEERSLVLKQIKENETLRNFKTDRQNIRKIFPELKTLSRSDRSIVYRKAMADTRKQLKIKSNSGLTLRTTEDCADSCLMAYGDAYYGCDDWAMEDLDICDETMDDCSEMCSTVPPNQYDRCIEECEENYDLCYLIVLFDYAMCYDGIDMMIEDCITENCIE